MSTTTNPTGKQANRKQAEPTPAKQTAKPTPQNCACGCGSPTVTAKAVFLSGHDARFAGRLGRGEIKPTAHQKAVLSASEALQAKVEKIRATHTRKQAEKKARQAAQQAASKAKQAVLAKAGV